MSATAYLDEPIPFTGVTEAETQVLRQALRVAEAARTHPLHEES